MFLAQRPFGSKINSHNAHLKHILVFLIIAVAQLHIEHSGDGIPIFGRESTGEEIGVLQYLAAQR